jgi:oligoribonuclease NrnB/cAMP/cGMP phosphodiesterase (DHH superfamily)
MEEQESLVIYHASCADGYTAAWVAYRYGHLRGLSHAPELWYAQYGSDPPDVTGRDVVIVDFSYPLDVMLELAKKAKSIICLDHHKTVADEVKDLDWVTFDNDKSGAMLAWDYFVEFGMGEWIDPPKLVGETLCRYVQDRDLWRWELPNSKEISAALTLSKMGIDEWTHFAQQLETNIETLLERGATVLAMQNLWAEQKTKHATLRTIRGFEVPCVNLAVKLQSEVGHMLVDVEDPPPFSASFFLTQQNGDEIAVFSLRSTERGEDVGAIAKSFGGGGHRNAAGFSVPLSDLFEGLN